MLSILIPTYNYNITTLVKRLHIEATSLHINFEILVREDASEKYIFENSEIEKLTNVTYSKNSENIGRSATRKALAEATSFDTLLFLDADVFPFYENFIKNYIENPETQVICGGITYTGVLPKENEQLRFVYGSKKEQQTAAQRTKRNYIITAGNFRIKRALFIEINTRLDNFYGDDLLLSQKLKQKEATVLQIDNPVKHLGLETSQQFLDKSLKGVTSLFEMEREGLLENDFTRLQCLYLKLKKLDCLPRLLNFFPTEKIK